MSVMLDNDARIRALLARLEANPKGREWEIWILRSALSMIQGGMPLPAPNETMALPTPEELADSGSQRQALYAIAYRNGGIVRVSQAAELIIAAGLSQSSKNVLFSTLWKAMNDSDNWEYVAPGTFRLVLYRPVAGSYWSLQRGNQRRQSKETGETRPLL